MKRFSMAAIFGIAVLLTFLAPVSASASPSCEGLMNLKIPDTTITSAALVPAGPYTPPGRPGSKMPTYEMPALCSVHLVVKPAINIEVWMPVDDWNGRIATVGDGSQAGFINYIDMVTPLKLGYVTASTDTGHAQIQGATGAQNFAWAAGDPEILIGYGYRGVHEMTLKTKMVVAAFYGKDAQYNYFIGCSNAGRQALMEVQRYPNDYDGVLAGAPLVSWTKQMAEQYLWEALVLFKDPESNIPVNKLPAIADASMAACDANDGVKDGLISDPMRCHFNPAVLLCKAEDSPSCLTAKQIESLKKLYSGPILDGKAVYQGYMPGSENRWTLVGTPEHYGGALVSAQAFFRNAMYQDPNWDFHTWSYEKNLPELRKKLSPILDAEDPNIKPFQAHGGKLLIYQGWADPTVAPMDTVRYYEDIEATIKNPTDTARMFMVPGMYHCGGGPGPHTFDPFSSLVGWVEHQHAPDRIITSNAPYNPLTAIGGPGGGIGVVNLDTPSTDVMRTRPLCPYPQTAQYTGQGSTDDASNFVCKLPNSN